MILGISWQLWLFIAALVVALACIGVGDALTWPGAFARAVQWMLRPILRRILRASE